MNQYERNRKAVQKGLERRAAQRAEAAREAAHDAAGRDMRRAINFRTEWGQTENEVAQAHQQREKEQAEQRKIRRAQVDREIAQQHEYLLRLFGCLIFSAIIVLANVAGRVSTGMAMTCLILAGMFIIIDGLEYFTCNEKRREHV